MKRYKLCYDECAEYGPNPHHWHVPTPGRYNKRKKLSAGGTADILESTEQKTDFGLKRQPPAITTLPSSLWDARYRTASGCWPQQQGEGVGELSSTFGTCWYVTYVSMPCDIQQKRKKRRYTEVLEIVAQEASIGATQLLVTLRPRGAALRAPSYLDSISSLSSPAPGKTASRQTSGTTWRVTICSPRAPTATPALHKLLLIPRVSSPGRMLRMYHPPRSPAAWSALQESSLGRGKGIQTSEAYLLCI